MRAVREADCHDLTGIKQDIFPPYACETGYCGRHGKLIRENTFHSISRVLVIGMLRDTDAITPRVIVFNLKRAQLLNWSAEMSESEAAG